MINPSEITVTAVKNDEQRRTHFEARLTTMVAGDVDDVAPIASSEEFMFAEMTRSLRREVWHVLYGSIRQDVIDFCHHARELAKHRGAELDTLIEKMLKKLDPPEA
jgi:hypothetical protein